MHARPTSLHPVPRRPRRRRQRRAWLAAAAVSAVLACARSPQQGPPAATTAPVEQPSAAAAASAATCAPDDAGLTLAAGFCASVFADSLGATRHLAVREDGAVFVARRGGAGSAATAAGVVALRDTDGDGRADQRTEFGPVGGTGIALAPGRLYLDARSAILRFPLPAGSLQPSGPPDTVAAGLPLRGHDAKTFVLDGRGGLFVNIGSLTNSCQQADRQNASPGVDPCTELETRAGIWRFDANRTGQTQAGAEHWAQGIRNAVALAFDPGGQLWAMQHGRDQLFQNWGTMFTEQQSAENPAEELLRVDRGDRFGWPYCYYSHEHGRLVLAPEYGGDGSAVGRCAAFEAPVAVFPGHWAPMALLFYTGSQLPARYREGVFITFHGSWNRAPLPQAGFNVVFQPLRDGRASGPYEVIADGFHGAEGSGRNAAHRPVGLAQAPDGSIYVTDDRGGRIYRLGWAGGG